MDDERRTAITRALRQLAHGSRGFVDAHTNIGGVAQVAACGPLGERDFKHDARLTQRSAFMSSAGITRTLLPFLVNIAR